MIRPAPFHVDCFAGGGGASEGYEMATGLPVNVALNHDPEAVAMHRMNHPCTQHECEDIRVADPVALCGGRQPTSAWFSPDCKDFSKAKGGRPKSKRVRGLAWTVVHWVNKVRPLVIYLENVEEFAEWCPLDRRGNRKKKLLGWFFRCFKGALERRGYRVEARELRACEVSSAPTIRKRLYLVARCDGEPIVWPEDRFGEGKAERQRCAADILDFTLPCPSIFMTRRQARSYTRRTGIKIKRPLAKASLQRLADGVGRYVIKDKDPFLVCLTHEGNAGVEAIRAPMKTVTGANRGERALVAPCLAVNTAGHAASDCREPIPTLTTGGQHIVAAAALAHQQHKGATRSVRRPIHTLSASTKDQNQMLVAHVAKMTTGGVGSSCWEPFPTVTAGSFKKRPGGNPPLGLVTTFLAQANHGEKPHYDVREPVRTVVAGGAHESLATVFLAQNNGGMVGHDARQPTSTINGRGANQAVVAVGLGKYYGTEQDPQLREPIHSITTRDRFGLFAAELAVPELTPAMADKARAVARFLRRHGVEVAGEFAMCGDLVIWDIGMRMLTPRELYRAQGFGDDYIINRGMFMLDDGTLEERPLTKTAQVRMCGNSVCPPTACELIRVNQPYYALKEIAA